MTLENIRFHGGLVPGICEDWHSLGGVLILVHIFSSPIRSRITCYKPFPLFISFTCKCNKIFLGYFFGTEYRSLIFFFFFCSFIRLTILTLILLVTRVNTPCFHLQYILEIYYQPPLV
jgi:hypothetical protein